jgi:hypothetical protein
VRALPTDAPTPSLEERCDALLERSSAELRLAVLERKIAAGGPRLASALHDPLERETPEVRGRVLEAWITRDGPRAVARAIDEAPVAIVSDALARIPAGSVAWEELVPLAARNLPAFDALLLPHALGARARTCLPFLVDVITRAFDEVHAHQVAAPLRREIVERAVAKLAPLLDEEPGPDPALRRLLSVAERVGERADDERSDVERLPPDEHALVGITGRLRHRLLRAGPHGWLGALRRIRGTSARSIVDHTVPDGTSSIVIAGSAGIELRAPAHELYAIASALPDGVIALALTSVGRAERSRSLDPDALDRALARAIPPYPAVARDLGQIARIASARGAALHAQFEEGWWDPEAVAVDRPTLIETD